MIVAISVALAYALLGLGKVAEGLAAHPVDQPGWTHRSTFGTYLMVFSTWPIAPLLRARMHPNPTRATAFAVMEVLMSFATMAGLVWGAIQLAIFLTSNWYAQVGLSIAFIIALRFILPIVTLLIMPLTMIVSAVLNLIFPLKSGR